MSKYLELVEGSFTQEHFDKQKNQNPYVAYSIRDNKVIYTIIPQDNGMYKFTFTDKYNADSYNPTMVDLGLPSGTLWADRNVGSVTPEDNGAYFAWGETEGVIYSGVKKEYNYEETLLILSVISGSDFTGIPKEDFDSMLVSEGIADRDLSLLGIITNKFFNWDTYFDTVNGGNNFNKYSNEEGKKTVLDSLNDVVYTSSNGQYRMPTSAEIQELIFGTTQTFIDLDGNEYSKEQAQNGAIESGKLKGVRFTSSNGNSIFIPAAGNCDESLLSRAGRYGELWSSSLDDGNGGYAGDLYFDYYGNVHENGGYRYYGRSVRGVQA